MIVYSYHSGMQHGRFVLRGDILVMTSVFLFSKKIELILSHGTCSTRVLRGFCRDCVDSERASSSSFFDWCSPVFIKVLFSEFVFGTIYYITKHIRTSRVVETITPVLSEGFGTVSRRIIRKPALTLTSGLIGFSISLLRLTVP